MMQKKGKEVIYIFCVILLSSIVSILDSNIATLFFSLLLYSFGIIFIRLFLKPEFKISFNLFSIFYIVFYLFVYVINVIYVKDPYRDYFINWDSTTFYTMFAPMLGKYNLDYIIHRIWSEFEYSDYRGFSLISAVMGYFANLIDHNDIFIQKLQNVVLAALIPVLIFNALSKFWNVKKAKSAAILFGLFSWISFYTAEYLRDIHVAFIYSIAIYLFFQKLSIKNFVLLCLLALTAGLFRPEHGLFFIAFIAGYIGLYYIESKRSFSKTIVIATAIAFMFAFFIFSGILGNAIANLTQNSTRYAEMSLSQADSGGIGIMLLKLPPGISIIARSIFSQIAPFPFYLAFNMFTPNAWSLPAVFATLFWYGVWGIIISGLYRLQVRNLINKRLWMLFILSILLIAAASSALTDVRRIMCVYPAIYIFCVHIYFHLGSNIRRRIIFNSAFVYIILLTLYFFIKV